MPQRGPGAQTAPEHRSLWIDVPGEEAGLALIERLGAVHAELAPRDEGCCRVAVEVRGRSDALLRVLSALPAWAASNGIAATRVELDGRPYFVRS